MPAAEVTVRAMAIRWESDDFPGWVEVAVVDAHAREHRIVEKVPILTELPITADSAFPFELWVFGQIVAIERDDVTVLLGHSVETVGQACELTLASGDVVWL